MSETRVSAFSGPIPSPAVLAQYSEIDLTLVNRIVAMAEAEQKHRHDGERVSAQFSASWFKRGQMLGGAMGIFTLILAAYAASLGESWVAGTAIGSTAGILGVFVWRGRSDSKPPTPTEDEPN